MAPPERFLSISVAAVMEDVLQQHGARLSDNDLASRKAEEAASRRYEAAGWLRKMVGVVAAKDLPDEPTEEEFRLGLRNGLVLCNALNKVHSGAVPKVVENSGDTVLSVGGPLSAYQYFENIKNFLVAVQHKGLPVFELSDLEQGGKSSRIVNCILALKAHNDKRQIAGTGSWKFTGTNKSVSSEKDYMRKTSEPLGNTLSRNLSSNERFQDNQNFYGDTNQSSVETNGTSSLNKLVHAVLSGKKPEEVPSMLETMLKRVMEEFERRIATQNELIKTTLEDLSSEGGKSFSKRKILAELPVASDEIKIGTHDKNVTHLKKGTCFSTLLVQDKESRCSFARQQVILDQQHRDIQKLRLMLHDTRTGMRNMQMKYSEELHVLGRHLHSLAYAASGYHRVLEENRKLYNQVQDLKGSIRVYCRVRPFSPGQPSSVSTISHLHDGNISVITSMKNGKEAHRSFTFNKVFGPSASQDEVFSDTRPLIRSVLDGYNVCIFAYGQTGSGKTYTMSGPMNITRESQGVNFRALSDLFYLSEQRKDIFCYDIAVQMIEIYNEQVRDLLATDGLNRRLEIRNNSQKGLNVPDANMVPVASTSEVIELMNMGQRNRAVGATALNDRSSRSHSCLTIHVQGREAASGTILRGCMHLVDLAGSERVDKSEVKGERLKEAQHINKSLSALGDVIAALAQKNSHVPYRNSKLTQLLQDSLGGQAKTLMFVHVNPEPDAIGETISTLKFAERASTVELGVARVNKESGEVKDLKEQIALLKAALMRKEESQHIRSMMMSTPEVAKANVVMKADTTSSVLPTEQSGPIPFNYATWRKTPGFYLEEAQTTIDSPPWQDSSPSACLHSAEEKETSLGDWVDKIMVNRQDTHIRYKNNFSDWGEASDLPFQRHPPNVQMYTGHLFDGNGKLHQDRHENEDTHGIQFEPPSADASEEVTITSDSSEADILCQFNPPKISSVVAGSAVRSKNVKTPDAKTPVQIRGPSSSWKASHGLNQLLDRAGRQQSPGASSGKRHLSTRRA